MDPDSRPLALVTGGSAGLGHVIAGTLLANGYRVIIVGRDVERLNEACDTLLRNAPRSDATLVGSFACDLTDERQVRDMFDELSRRYGRLDALINCVGTSDRGLIETLKVDRLEELLRQNVMTALLCSQAAMTLLEASRGSVVNIGSLASKVGARYIGGYATAKHALAGMTQQLRLEWKSRGIHVGLVSPGPIRREDAGLRYAEAIDDSLPSQAAAPGGGSRLKGLPPERVARAVLRCIQKRTPDVVLPRHLRVLIAIGHAFPRLGDWLLLRFTSTKTP